MGIIPSAAGAMGRLLRFVLDNCWGDEKRGKMVVEFGLCAVRNGAEGRDNVMVSGKGVDMK